jgi:hypothetical protein
MAAMELLSAGGTIKGIQRVPWRARILNRRLEER